MLTYKVNNIDNDNKINGNAFVIPLLYKFVKNTLGFCSTMALDAESKVHSVRQITNFDGFNIIVGIPVINKYNNK